MGGPYAVGPVFPTVRLARNVTRQVSTPRPIRLTVVASCWVFADPSNPALGKPLRVFDSGGFLYSITLTNTGDETVYPSLPFDDGDLDWG